MNTDENNWFRKLFPLVVLSGALLLLVSCGSYGSGGTTMSPAPGAGASAVVNITDSPSDRIIAFELTVNSITFVRTDGAMYSVLKNARHVELTHLSGTAEPLVLPTLPQGTYKSATIDLSAPEVVYIDNAGNKVEKEFPNATFTLNVPLNPNVTIGTTPPVLTLDINAAASVTIDPVTGNVTVNPVASIQQGQIPGAEENEKDPEDGDFEHVVGQVSTVGANSFTIMLGDDSTLTFLTDGSTRFEGAASAATLPLNSTVRVEGHAQPDGTVLASEVEVVSMTGSEFEGLITAATGNPVTSFDLVVQDGNGNGTDTNTLSTTKTVTVSNNTKFKVDSGSINVGGLNVPSFSASSLTKGQRVEAESESAQNGTAFTADSVKLQQQSLVGAISARSTSQFTLTLPADSAFKLLTGKSTITVLTPAGTQLRNGVTITNAAVVSVRGLVFFDPTSGNYSMVAGRVNTP